MTLVIKFNRRIEAFMSSCCTVSTMLVLSNGRGNRQISQVPNIALEFYGNFANTAIIDN